MTRTGKIAGLPRHIRGQLNARFDKGEGGQPLLEWLNHLPEVTALANGQAGGSAVTEEDLRDWQQGGYQQWVRHQEACEVVRDLAEQAADLDNAAEDEPVSECLSPVLGTELARSAKSLLAESTPPSERWQRLREVLGEFARLRKGDQQSLRVRLECERWARERDRQDEEQHQLRVQKLKARATAPFWTRLMRGPLAESFGGGEAGEKAADYILAIQHDLPIPTGNKPGETVPNPLDPSSPANLRPPP
jgi:hypothetical protein